MDRVTDVDTGVESHIISPEKATVLLLGSRPKLPALIVDIDGTLADSEGIREPYDWSKVGLDKVIEPVRRLIQVYANHLHFQIIYLTGRDEAARDETNKWLSRHSCPAGPLLMAPKGSRAPSQEVKTALYREHVEGKYDVEFALEDRNKLVKMWRDLGVRCFQVAESDY